MFKKMYAVVAAVVLSAFAMVAPVAHAAAGAAVDVTDVTGTIAAQLTPIGLVGVACLGVYVAVKAFHWVRRALS